MALYDMPVPAPTEDLPGGLSVLVACEREVTAREVVQEAFRLRDHAQAYADHVAGLSIALGALTYADVAAAAGVSRQASRQRYLATVEATQREIDEDAASPAVWS